MCRYYTDIPSLYFHDLNLTWRPTRESKDSRAETTEPEGVVCGLKHRRCLDRHTESVQVYAVGQHNDDPCMGDAYSLDWRAALKSGDRFLLCVIPYDDLLLYYYQRFAELVRCQRSYRPCSGGTWAPSLLPRGPDNSFAPAFPLCRYLH